MSIRVPPFDSVACHANPGCTGDVLDFDFNFDEFNDCCVASSSAGTSTYYQGISNPACMPCELCT